MTDEPFWIVVAVAVEIVCANWSVTLPEWVPSPMTLAVTVTVAVTVGGRTARATRAVALTPEAT